jgi:hypothetical protein
MMMMVSLLFGLLVVLGVGKRQPAHAAGAFAVLVHEVSRVRADAVFAQPIL